VEEAPELEAVVLYGSVARGEAHEDSDIDVLVLTSEATPEIAGKVRRLSSDIEAEQDHGTLFVPSLETVSRFRWLAVNGSPYAKAILRQGKALYDRGAFAELRQDMAARWRAGMTGPSDELLEQHMRAAERALIGARALVEVEDFEGVASRAYYAMFNAATAAVITTGIEDIRSHQALIELFRLDVALKRGVELEHADNLKAAFKLRLDADYEPGFRVDRAEATKALEQAERFIARIRGFLAQNPEPGS
jgi:uncharacterized protein (UPF0332 family)/predicted nucleotidyltransferase